MSGAAVVLRQNRLMRRFSGAGAVTASTARTPDELGIRRSFVFKRMVYRGVFVECADGRYYMDLEAADAFLRRRASIGAVFMIVVVLILSAFLFSL